METDQFVNELFKDYLRKSDFSDDQKQFIYEIMCLYNKKDNIDFLYNIYEAYMQEQETIISDNNTDMIFKYETDKCILQYKDKKVEFQKDEFKRFISSFISIVEKIYPLGTVVNLKKVFLDKLLHNKEIDKVQIVITDRFITFRESETYFEYAGVVYPVGHVGIRKEIYFTSQLIENVVHEGYSDEKEDAYIYLSKNDLINEKGKYSLSFGNKEEIEKMNLLLRGSEKNDQSQRS